MLRFLLPLTLCLLLVDMAARGEDGVKAVRGDLTVAIDVKGRFEPGEARGVVLSPAAYRGRYVVWTAVPPGTVVSAGDVVLRFDERSLRDAVEAARVELDTARRKVAIAETRRALAAEAAAQSLERHEYELAVARMRRDGYRDQTLAFSRRQYEMDLAQVRHGLENAREELRQLERMYAEDELVDETEEIVLARARFDVKNREGRLALRIARRAYSVEFEEKPALEGLEREVGRRETALRRAEMEAGLAARARTMEAERADRDLMLRERNLRRLAADLEAMVVRAPADGILLHGRARGGLGRRFGTGQQVNPAEPVLSVVPAGGIVAVVKVPAKERLRTRPGLEALLTPAARGAGSPTGRIVSVGRLPEGDSFEVTVEPADPVPAALLGTGLKARIVVERLEDVLLIPADRVRKEGDRRYCRTGSAEDPREVEVRLGATDGARVVVTHGLREGDPVLRLDEKR